MLEEKLAEEAEQLYLSLQESIVAFSPIDLLSKVGYLMHFANPSKKQLTHMLQERPILYLLSTLFLTRTEFGEQIATEKDVRRIIKLADAYYLKFHFSFASFREKTSVESDIEDLVFQARSIKLINDVNPEGYIFQFEEMINDLYSHFDEFFLEKVGFTTHDAWEFGHAIIHHAEHYFDTKPSRVRKQKIFSFIECSRISQPVLSFWS